MPPMPSLLCRGRFVSAGTKPLIENPTVSVRLRPTWPEPLPMPFEKRADFELSSRRADSQALAATTPALHRTCFSVRVALSTYETAVTLPSELVINSRAMAPVRIVRRPDFIAGKIIAWLEEKADAV